MSADADLAKAEADATVARQRFSDTAAVLKARLAPGALARDAGEKAKAAGSDILRSTAGAARRHPLPAIGIIAALGALLARKPIIRSLRRTPRRGAKPEKE